MHDATKSRENPFWHYSLTQYAKPGCASFLISAQDEKQLDINILLFIGWISKQGLSLSHSQLHKAQQWNQYCIQPIRWLRRKSKPFIPNPVYKQFKKIELWAEQREQQMLFSLHYQLASFDGTTHECFKSNMREYTKGKESLDKEWLQALKQYLQQED